MISTRQAYDWISDMTPDEVRVLTAHRILGEDTMPVGGGYFDEASEDLVIQLLRNDELPEDVRSAVVSGCCDVYAQLLAWLAAPGMRQNGLGREEVATRLCSVVDVAAPQELRGRADALLNLALSAAELPSSLLSAAVRATMAYAHTRSHIPLWEEVIQSPEVAAYAFNALLEIDPHADRIEQALVTLWQKQLREDWRVDTAFLMRRAARARGSETIIARVLLSLDDELARLPEGQQLRQNLEEELQRRDWSRSWGHFAQPETPSGEIPSRQSPHGQERLIISRKKSESIVIDDDITVRVVKIRGDKVRLSIEHPLEVPVHRGEVLDAIHRAEEGGPMKPRPIKPIDR